MMCWPGIKTSIELEAGTGCSPAVGLTCVWYLYIITSPTEKADVDRGKLYKGSGRQVIYKGDSGCDGQNVRIRGYTPEVRGLVRHCLSPQLYQRNQSIQFNKSSTCASHSQSLPFPSFLILSSIEHFVRLFDDTICNYSNP
jgi:hypothetical protein